MPFCLDRRIAGKEFARIGVEEHPDLRRKLRSIEGKGGPGETPRSGKAPGGNHPDAPRRGGIENR